MKRDRASELRAIADGRLMLHVRNGVTVARSMLARIADEFETMSTALAAKDAELAAKHEAYCIAHDQAMENGQALQRAEAQLAEANKALEPFAKLASEVDYLRHGDGSTSLHRLYASDLRAARRALGRMA